MSVLSKGIKEKILEAILDDLPEVDYEEKIRKVLLKLAVAKLPSLAKTLWNDASTRGLLRTESIYIYSDQSRHHWSTRLGSATLPGYNTDIEELANHPEVRKLADEATAQRDRRTKLTVDLKAMFDARMTAKDFVDRFPPFESYLPAAEALIVNLPATTAVVDSLREAGWPVEKTLDNAEASV